tara:strand:+ start:910 stop:2091 length:1182 start_codon:yes stop_codon:yes gene_type:complete
MIGKVAKLGTSFLGCLEYVVEDKKSKVKEPRGKLVYHQNLFCLNCTKPDSVPVKRIAMEFDAVLQFNSRIEKPVLHQSFSFPPGEHLEDAQLILIVVAFSEKFCLDENQLVVYKHMDKAHEHVHIIANRLTLRGDNTYIDSYNYFRTGNFSRQMEVRLGLQPTTPMHSRLIDGKLDVSTDNVWHKQLRIIIDKTLSESRSLNDLKGLLLQKGWKSYGERGISFVHEGSGAKVRGSQLGRAYSLPNLEKRLAGFFKKGYILSEKSESLRRSIRIAAISSSSLREFENVLKLFGYSFCIQRNKEEGNVDQFCFQASNNYFETKSESVSIYSEGLGNEFHFDNIIRNILDSESEWQLYGNANPGQAFIVEDEEEFLVSKLVADLVLICKNIPQIEV